MIRIELPGPPSTNNLFFNVPKRGRVKSPRYQAWEGEAGLLLKAQKPGRLTGNVEMILTVPQKTRADLDNLAKPILDLLVTHSVIEDDGKPVQRVTVQRGPTPNPKTCIVEVRSAP